MWPLPNSITVTYCRVFKKSCHSKQTGACGFISPFVLCVPTTCSEPLTAVCTMRTLEQNPLPLHIKTRKSPSEVTPRSLACFVFSPTTDSIIIQPLGAVLMINVIQKTVKNVPHNCTDIFRFLVLSNQQSKTINIINL